MKDSMDELHEKKKAWEKANVARLAIQKRIDEAEAADKFAEIPDLYSELLQLDKIYVLQQAESTDESKAAARDRESLQVRDDTCSRLALKVQTKTTQTNNASVVHCPVYKYNLAVALTNAGVRSKAGSQASCGAPCQQPSPHPLSRVEAVKALGC